MEGRGVANASSRRHGINMWVRGVGIRVGGVGIVGLIDRGSRVFVVGVEVVVEVHGMLGAIKRKTIVRIRNNKQTYSDTFNPYYFSRYTYLRVTNVMLGLDNNPVV